MNISCNVDLSRGGRIFYQQATQLVLLQIKYTTWEIVHTKVAVVDRPLCLCCQYVRHVRQTCKSTKFIHICYEYLDINANGFEILANLIIQMGAFVRVQSNILIRVNFTNALLWKPVRCFASSSLFWSGIF